MHTFKNNIEVNTVYYLDNVEIRNGDVVVNHSDGRVVYENGAGDGEYQYYLKDHLGNVRLSFAKCSEVLLASCKNDDITVINENHYYPFGLKMEGDWNTTTTFPEVTNQYNGKEWVDDLGLDMNDYGARWYDPATARWSSVDPLAEKYYGYSGYNYVLGNPVSNIDPDGRWVIKINDKGKIQLIAELGDNRNSLINYFGDLSNASQYLPKWSLNKNISYKEGDVVTFNEHNIFSETVQYYHNNKEEFDGKNTWDCKELCRQTVLNNEPIISSKSGGSSSNDLYNFGKDWGRKMSISEDKQKFGETFSYWSFTGLIGDHAGVYFGKDNSGATYYLSKNGLRGPLKIGTFEELNNDYYWLPDFSKTDYKNKYE